MNYQLTQKNKMKTTPKLPCRCGQKGAQCMIHNPPFEFLKKVTPKYRTDEEIKTEWIQTDLVKECIPFENAVADWFLSIRHEDREWLRGKVENGMSYIGVLESNEKRRGYEIACQEILSLINQE